MGSMKPGPPSGGSSPKYRKAKTPSVAPVVRRSKATATTGSTSDRVVRIRSRSTATLVRSRSAQLHDGVELRLAPSRVVRLSVSSGAGRAPEAMTSTSYVREPSASRTVLAPVRPVAAICGSGQRSAVAASLLKRFGAQEVVHVVDGGALQWQRSGWPIES
jgi:rhodanese-related sulfurtransferase